MLVRFDPFRDFDRMTEQLFGSARSALPIDAFRRGDEFHVAVDLPGVDPGSIDVTVERNVLTIRAERAWQPGEGDEVVMAERPQGSFTRQLLLGETLDAERIDARYEHGVLLLTIPVAEEAKPRRVQIQSGNGAATKAVEAGSSEKQGSEQSAHAAA